MLKIWLFSEKGCGACSLNETRIKDVLKDFPKISFQHVDIESHGDLIKKYQVLTAPTIVVTNDDKKIYEITGIIERERFHRELVYLNFKTSGII
ncbi:MAG: thioredoxin family protein [Bacilli bacterium]|nr:thioredoxin family protein [Bacilli bacterium]